jgi:hypothetical protein
MWGESRQEREHWWEKDRARCKYCSRAIRGRHREDYGGMQTCLECYSRPRRRTRQWFLISA